MHVNTISVALVRHCKLTTGLTYTMGVETPVSPHCR